MTRDLGEAFIYLEDDGVRVRVRLTPRSRRSAIGLPETTPDGVVLTAHVREVPEKGRANRALVGLIASWIGVAKSAVELKAGSRSRYKTVAIRGEPQELTARIRQGITALEAGDTT